MRLSVPPLPIFTLRKGLRSAGYSLLELIITIAVIGLVASIGVTYISGDVGTGNVAKLESDIATLNQMVALYTADGGSVAGLTSPQAVIDKLKRARPQAEWQSHAGVVSGRLLDVRLQARMSSKPDHQNNPRAVWNRTKQRFELSKAGGTAISEFYLEETLAGRDYGTESRGKSTMAFNAGKSGWVWGAAAGNTPVNYLNPQPFNPENPAAPFNPDEGAPESTQPPDDPTAGGGGGGGGGSGGEEPTGPTVARLPRPTVSPGGGTFAFNAFPNTVTIDRNGAPAQASTLMYRINSGAWTEYNGSPITLTPAMSLQTRNVSTRPAEYQDSNTLTQNYHRLTSGFSGTGTGTWGNAIGGSNLVTTIQNDSGDGSVTFKHGNTKLDLGNGEFLDAGVENVLKFTPEGFDTVVPNTWFTFGHLMMLNGTTFYNSEASGVTLSVNLAMTQPALNFIAHIDLGLISTENTSDRLASADIVELKTPTTDLRITIDGVEYRLELSWMTLDPGAGVVQGNRFLVFEGATAQAELRARFTSNR